MPAVVDETLLKELEDMGFPLARATRALHFSGNSTVEGAVNWLEGHGDDADLDEPLLVKKVWTGGGRSSVRGGGAAAGPVHSR